MLIKLAKAVKDIERATSPSANLVNTFEVTPPGAAAINITPKASSIGVFKMIINRYPIIGRTTSGNYSFNFKKNLMFGYVNNDISNDELQKKKLFVEVEKQKYPIKLNLKPLKQTNFKNI